MNQPQQQNSPIETGRAAMYLLVFLCQAMALSVEVFLHKQLGRRAIGLRGFAAFFMIPFWTAFWPEEDARPLLLFWWAFIGMCLWSRTVSIIRENRRHYDHSRYTGWPRLKLLLPRCGEFAFKRYVEPGIVFFTGALLLGLSQPLGSYLMAAAFGLMASVAVNEAVEEAEAREIHDAMIRQSQLNDRVRRRRGDY